ncbi:MAG: hypothetical protein AAGF79_13350 [Pseudomonadota bacterium]
MSRPWVPESFASTGLYVQRGSTPVARFQVVGERSSGTNFVKRLMGRNTGLTPTEVLGWKHGPSQVLAIPRDLLIVISVRHAGDWARSMHAKPWHASPELQALTCSDFLRAPWTSVIDRPRYFDIDGVRELVGQPLQADIDPTTGASFSDLFALRQGKLLQHLSYLRRHSNVVLLRMERAIDAPEETLDALLSGLDLPQRIGPLRPVVKRLGSKFKGAVERPDTPDDLSSDDLAYLRSRVDQETEIALGYSYDSTAPGPA